MTTASIQHHKFMLSSALGSLHIATTAQILYLRNPQAVTPGVLEQLKDDAEKAWESVREHAAALEAHLATVGGAE